MVSVLSEPALHVTVETFSGTAAIDGQQRRAQSSSEKLAPLR
jgi:hypothetical protein